MDMRMTGETLLTRFDTVVRFINGPQLIAVILQIMRPSSEPGRDFQNRVRRQTLANPRKNCAGPLGSRAAPRFRPFLAGLFPVIFHLLATGSKRFLRYFSTQRNVTKTLPLLHGNSFAYHSFHVKWVLVSISASTRNVHAILVP